MEEDPYDAEDEEDQRQCPRRVDEGAPSAAILLARGLRAIGADLARCEKTERFAGLPQT